MFLYYLHSKTISPFTTFITVTAFYSISRRSEVSKINIWIIAFPAPVRNVFASFKPLWGWRPVGSSSSRCSLCNGLQHSDFPAALVHSQQGRTTKQAAAQSECSSALIHSHSQMFNSCRLCFIEQIVSFCEQVLTTFLMVPCRFINPSENS